MMRHRLLILLFALFTVGVCYAERVVIPTPQHYEQHEGSITIMHSSVVCYADDSLAPLAKYLADKLGIDHKRGDDGTIVLAMDDTLAAEGYHLIVDTKRIIIVGGEYGGAFNGEGAGVCFALVDLLIFGFNGQRLSFRYGIGFVFILAFVLPIGIKTVIRIFNIG